MVDRGAAAGSMASDPADGGERVSALSTTAKLQRSEPATSPEQDTGKCTEEEEEALRLGEAGAHESATEPPDRKGSDASLMESASADEPAAPRRHLVRATAAVAAAAADGKTFGWPRYGRCGHALPPLLAGRDGCEQRCCARGCSLQGSRGRRLVLVALNAAHVVLGGSMASVAAGDYAVVSAAAGAGAAGASPPSSAACFTCAAFVATGTCGLYQVLVSGSGRCRRRPRRCQRIVYTCLSALSGSAALIVAAFAAKQLVATAAPTANDHSEWAGAEVERTPLATCAGILLALAALELAVAGAACHRQSWTRRRHLGGRSYGIAAANAAEAAAGSHETTAASAGSGAERYPRHSYERSHCCSDTEQRRWQRRKRRRQQQQQHPLQPAAGFKAASRWLALLLVMFNAAHVAAGVCTLELALVGMTLARRVDNSQTAGLFTAALVSPLFLAAGCYGLYAIFARKLATRPVRLAYAGVCSATAVGSLVVVGLLAVGSAARQPITTGQQQQEWLLPMMVMESLLWLSAGAEVVVSVAAVTVYQVYYRQKGSLP